VHCFKDVIVLNYKTENSVTGWSLLSSFTSPFVSLLNNWDIGF